MTEMTDEQAVQVVQSIDHTENGHTKALSRDDILAAKFTPITEKVEVPEWGGHVYVKEMRGSERDAFERSLQEQRGNSVRANMSNFRAKLVSFTACDANGVRLFTAQDARELGERSAKALARIAEVSGRLSGLMPEDVEELTKGMGEEPAADSGSN